MKKNKIVIILSALLLVLIIATGCSSTPTATETPASNGSPAVENESSATTDEAVTKGDYIDGTYEGTSDAGIHPGLKVSVVVENGNITAVNIIEHNETEGIGTVALEKIPALIVEAQSVEVDAVTGASLSSTAIKEAVDKALEQAK